MNEWIKTSEQKPEMDDQFNTHVGANEDYLPKWTQLVLVCGPNRHVRVCRGQYRSGDRRFVWDCHDGLVQELTDVERTYWMPLPALPTD